MMRPFILSWRLKPLLVAVAAGLGATSLHAQSNDADRNRDDIMVRGRRHPVIGGTREPTCVDQADCPALRALRDPAEADRRTSGGALDARSGDVAVGVGSLSGSSQRLGADLRSRTSLPTRPPRPPLPSSAFVGTH